MPDHSESMSEESDDEEVASQPNKTVSLADFHEASQAMIALHPAYRPLTVLGLLCQRNPRGLKGGAATPPLELCPMSASDHEQELIDFIQSVKP